MAALIYRAGELDRIDRYKSEYLWRQMSTRGFRIREPHLVDFERERTTVMDALVANTVEEMGYSPGELVQMLHLNYDELVNLYQLERAVGLRVVK